MANTLTTNPVFIDTAAGSTITDQRIQAIQWIDDAGDMANADDLDFTINGVTIHLKVDTHTSASPVQYAVHLSHPIVVKTFVVNTIDHGAVLVWLS